MRINYNISAMIANNSLKANDNSLAASIERLSSGLKINHAKDNASGLAMAKRMNAQIRSLEQANQNSNDGVSVIEIAEGALTEIEDMVQRMNELAVKACNGTLSDEDRETIDDEITQLKAEIERVANTTMYNGEVLLNGNFDVKGYTNNLDVKVTTYSDDVRSSKYTIQSLELEMDAEGNIKINDIDLGGDFPDGATATVENDAVKITGANGFEIELQIKDNLLKNPDGSSKGPVTLTGDTALKLDITGLGALNVQIGTNEGQELGVRIATISLRTLGVENLNVKTADNAQAFLDQMTNSLSYINSARSRLGSYQNRLEHTINTLDVSDENMTAAYSRIMDVDMAEEMTYYSTAQVLVQAGTSMLAQANERPSSVLQLLQG